MMPAPDWRPTSDLDHRFYASSIVRTGGKHKDRGENGQDHALVRRTERGFVLAVADGVSTCTDSAGFRMRTRCEVGSWLVAEVASAAAERALASGVAPGEIGSAVAAAIARAFGPLWAEIGRERGKIGLCSTLLVAVVTADEAHVWASGDGFWGVIVPQDAPAGAMEIVSPRAIGRTPDHFSDRFYAAGRHTPVINRLATTAARRDAASVEAELEHVLAFHGRAVAVHIATDGLQDHPALDERARTLALQSKGELEALIVDGDHTDDLAIAWVAEREFLREVPRA